MMLTRMTGSMALLICINLTSWSAGQFQLEINFLPGDFGYSAKASLLVEDLNMDNHITADTIRGIYDTPSEVAEASIDFFIDDLLVASYDNADNFVVTYPFLIFGYDIQDNSLDWLDLGADPGIYTIYTTDWGSDLNAHFYITDTSEQGIFGGIEVTVISGDFNNDGVWDTEDIDLLTQLGDLVAGVAATNETRKFDLNSDDIINVADVDEWLADAADANGLSSPYLYGDANLDGVVDGSDFLAWNNFKFTESLSWSEGNFQPDGIVDGADFLEWNNNKFQQSDVQSVPEPTSTLLLLMTLIVVARLTA